MFRVEGEHSDFENSLYSHYLNAETQEDKKLHTSLISDLPPPEFHQIEEERETPYFQEEQIESSQNNQSFI